MMILKMVGMTPGPLVSAFFHCVLTYYVGRFSGLGYGVFVPIGVKSKYGVFVFVVFMPIVVKSKGV